MTQQLTRSSTDSFLTQVTKFNESMYATYHLHMLLLGYADTFFIANNCEISCRHIAFLLYSLLLCITAIPFLFWYAIRLRLRYIRPWFFVVTNYALLMYIYLSFNCLSQFYHFSTCLSFRFTYYKSHHFILLLYIMFWLIFVTTVCMCVWMDSAF